MSVHSFLKQTGLRDDCDYSRKHRQEQAKRKTKFEFFPFYDDNSDMAHHEYDDILEALRQLKPQLQRQYPAISYLGLFGSYVRDEQQVDSDVDILIDFDFSIGKISLFDYSDIAHFLSEHLGKKVDLAHKSELRPRIGQHILSEVKEVI